MQITNFLTILLLFLAVVHANVDSVFSIPSQISKNLLSVQVISRHCDRIPSSSNSFPSYPVDFPKLSGLKLGDLTGLGQYQCYQLGNMLYDRYVSTLSLNRIQSIDTNYNPSQYFFRSSDFDRTLMSMWSTSMGLFKQGTGARPIVDFNQDANITQFSLPLGTQAIPIHTVPQNMDAQLLGFSLCKTVMKRLKDAMMSPEFSYFLKKNRQFIDRLYAETGWTKSDFELESFFDLLIVYDSHNLLNSNFFLQNNWDRIIELKNSFFILGFNYNIIGKEGGSDLLLTILSKFDSGYKYIHYSAHDTTIQTAGSALNMTYDYPFLGYQSGYGSYLIFELHEMLDGSQAIRIVNGNQFDDNSFKKLKLTSLGCNFEFCPRSQFEILVKDYSTVENWNLACNGDNNGGSKPPVDDYELPLKILVPLLAASNLGTLILLCFCILVAYNRKKTVHISAESSYIRMKNEQNTI